MQGQQRESKRIIYAAADMWLYGFKATKFVADGESWRCQLRRDRECPGVLGQEGASA